MNIKTLETNWFKQAKIFWWYYGKTSTVIFESFSDQMTAVKEYHWFSKEEILIYHRLQNHFKEQIDWIYDVKDKNLYLHSNRINQIKIQLLELPEKQIYESCYNTNYDDLKDFQNFKEEPFPVVQLPYVLGPDIWALENSLWFKRQEPQKTYYYELLNLINEIYRIISEKIWIWWEQLFLENIKINQFDNWILEIVITDIAWDIKGMTVLEKESVRSLHTVQT